MRLFNPLQPPAIQSNMLDAHYQYREFMPCKALLPYVACYWTVDFQASDRHYTHRIIPDGCIDIIFDLKAPSNANAAFAVGLMTSYETIELSASCSLFGIRFFAESASRFIKCSASELAGYQANLDDLWGKEGSSFMDEVRSSNSISEAIERVESVLLKACLQPKTESDPLLQSSLKYMYASKGTMSVRDLAETVCYSERNLSRIYEKELGVSPKKLLDIIRFQYILQGLHHSPSARQAEFAVNYGFYDQSHFIHKFKRLYGLPPKQVFK